MKAGFLRRVVSYLACIALVSPAAARPASGQQASGQQESVAEAARRARERKKKSEKPEKVITEDDLKPKPAGAADEITNATASVPAPATGQGTTAAQPAGAPVASGGAGAQPGAVPAAGSSAQEDAEALKKASAELARLKEKLADAQKDLDLAQREYALDRESYYSNPNYTDDASGKAKLDGLQAQIQSDQQQVANLKEKIAKQQEAVERLKGKAPAASRRNEAAFLLARIVSASSPEPSALFPRCLEPSGP